MASRDRRSSGGIAVPRLRAGLTEADRSVHELLIDEGLLDGLSLSELDFSEAAAELVDVSGCRWTLCKLAGSQLEKLTISDCVFDQCDLANARWGDSSAVRTAISASRLTGLSAPGLQLQHVTVRDSVLDFASFRFAKFTRVEIVDCRLTKADFVSADLSGTVFRRCDLGGAEFSNATARKAVFVECDWEGARGIGSLAGATIANSSPTDNLAIAAAMAGALQITLGDPLDHVEAT